MFFIMNTYIKNACMAIVYVNIVSYIDVYVKGNLFAKDILNRKTTRNKMKL